jgi:hypothetical protein
VTGAVVNLRRVRKAKARLEQADKAAEKRVRFGRTLADRQAQTDLAAKAARHLDAHRLDPSAASDDG